MTDESASRGLGPPTPVAPVLPLRVVPQRGPRRRRPGPGGGGGRGDQRRRTGSGSCSGRCRCCVRTRSGRAPPPCAPSAARPSGSWSGSAIMIGVADHTVLLWVLLPLAVLLSGVAPSMISFAAGQAGFTLVVIILFNIIQPIGWKVGLTRIEDVAIGCGVSIVVGLLFWPRGATAALGRALSDGVRRPARRYLADAVERLDVDDAGTSTPTPASRPSHRAYLLLDDAFRQFFAERGAKVVPVETISRLFTGSNRIRLAAYTLGPPARSILRPQASPSWSRWRWPRRSCATPTHRATAGTRSSPTCWPTGARRSTNRQPTARSSTTSCARRSRTCGTSGAPTGCGRRCRCCGPTRSSRARARCRSDLQASADLFVRGRRRGVLDLGARPDLRPPARAGLARRGGDSCAAVPLFGATGQHSRRLGGNRCGRREVSMGLKVTYPKRVLFSAAAVMACGACVTVASVLGAAGADAATTTTTVAEAVDHHHDGAATTTTAKPPTTTRRRRRRRPRPQPNVPAPTVACTVDDDHHDGRTAARRQPAQHQCADAARRGAERHRGAVPGQQRGHVRRGTARTCRASCSSPGGPYLYDARGVSSSCTA